MKDLEALLHGRETLSGVIQVMREELRNLFPLVPGENEDGTPAPDTPIAGESEIFLMEMADSNGLGFEDCSELEILDIADHLIKQAKLLE